MEGLLTNLSINFDSPYGIEQNFVTCGRVLHYHMRVADSESIILFCLICFIFRLQQTVTLDVRLNLQCL